MAQLGAERKFFLREFFAFCKAGSRGGCGIHSWEIGITKIESRSHDALTVESHLPAACARNLGDESVGVELAEDAADFGALLFGIPGTCLQLKRRLEFGSDVAVGKPPQTVFSIHDCPE